MVKEVYNVFNYTFPTMATVDVEGEETNITATIGINMGLLKRLFERVKKMNTISYFPPTIYLTFRCLILTPISYQLSDT